MKIRRREGAVQRGISLPALQRLLDHDDLATTQINLNLSPEHVIEEFEAKWWGDRFLRGRAVISGNMTFHIFCFSYVRFTSSSRHSMPGAWTGSYDPTRTFRLVFSNWRVGQKNYLFMGSERGGKSAAVAYTLIETAKLSGVEPQA